MQRTKNEILSLAAFIPWSLLPEGVQEDIKKDVLTRFLRQHVSELTDDNTELFFIKEQGDCCDFRVNACVFWDSSDDPEPPECETVYLGLTAQERSQIDKLIIERTLYALQHIEEI